MSGHGKFADRLLAWWNQHGRKDLPWQHPRTPYRVWISEIMLQQTQVSTVIPYFERWMQDFPDIETLANAPLDEVLAHWAGLGYYARARNLHKAAQWCRDHNDHALPSEAEALAALPGIGLSTANAIVSQASDKPAAVLDGNVRRVLARHAAVEGWSGKAAVQKILWREAESRLPEKRGADYTQAIMDLGATVCKRRKPNCPGCPVNSDCRARAEDRIDELPTAKPATKISEQRLQLAIMRDSGGKVLLYKRPPSGIWGGLWCLPSLQELGYESPPGQMTTSVEHRLSHVKMTIDVYTVSNPLNSGVECGNEHGWFEAADHRKLGLPRPIGKLLAGLDSPVQQGEQE